jgi:hypothetical protein
MKTANNNFEVVIDTNYDLNYPAVLDIGHQA